MAVLDFLFQGSPPASATETTTATSATPAWYQEYLRGLLSKGSAIAGAGYTPYQGARTAGFTPEQEQSFSMAGALPTTGGTPTYSTATNTIQQGTTGSAANVATPYASAAATPTYSTVGNYMSPYTSSVTDEIARLGNRNFSENIMPGINNSFISAGQSGSGRNAEILGQSARDVQADITGKQAAALESGYNTALTTAGQDATRQGQLAGTMGAISGEDLNRSITGGAALGDIGQAQQQTALENLAATSAVGDQKQSLNQANLDTAYQDFIAQRDWDKNQSYYMSDLVRGMQPSATSSTSSTTTSGGGTASKSPLSQILGTVNLVNSLKRGGLVRSKGALPSKRGH